MSARPSQIPASLVVDPDEEEELPPDCLDEEEDDYCGVCRATGWILETT